MREYRSKLAQYTTSHVDQVLPKDRAVGKAVEIAESVGREHVSSDHRGDLHQSICPFQLGGDEVDVADDGAGTHVLQLVAHRLAADVKLCVIQRVGLHVVDDEPAAGL